jgi:predicted nuclease of restriction endonuclease-like (RecB) superfamily
MAKPAKSLEPLYRDIRGVLESARAGAYRAVNFAMVQSYWQIGRVIVEHEQKGKKRAEYGEAVLEELSRRLTEEFGKGFDASNLWKMRQFHLLFPILDAPRLESEPAILDAPRLESGEKGKKRNALRTESLVPIRHAVRGESGPGLRSELSWTHYRLLLRVESAEAREWYMHEAADEHWSTRQLERQISTLYYERLLASRKKAPVRKEAAGKLAQLEPKQFSVRGWEQAPPHPEQFIRDPYVLEFLDLKDYPALRESTVEQAIIDNLQAFLLELGKGFSFVARQKRIRFEDEDFYIDLVFYNYLLKCFVLIDLKVGKLTHQDIGQMDSYVRVFDAEMRPAGDNPSIGLILCSTKNEAMAKYSVLSEGKQIFASKYVHVLPSEEMLKREIERERRLIESRAATTEGK